MACRSEAEISLDLRLTARGTVTVFSDSGNALYLIEHVKKSFCTPATTSLYRMSGQSGRGDDAEPYAVSYGKRVDLVEHANTPPSLYSVSEFLYKQPGSPFLTR
jgi:hypothetical protein